MNICLWLTSFSVRNATQSSPLVGVGFHLSRTPEYWDTNLRSFWTLR